MVAQSAENVLFYLGGIFCVLCFVLAALWELLPAVSTGRVFRFRFRRSVAAVVLIGAGPALLLIVGLALTLSDI